MRPIAPLPAPPPLTLHEVFDAYFDCRKNKRNANSAIEFEINLERNLIQLYNELADRTYQIGPSTVFAVTKPKPREIWAAQFRDRIVHHILYNRIAPAIQRTFIKDVYSCIPGRGTHSAVARARHYLASTTNNWQTPAYYLKADISNFFVSINKNILIKQLHTYVKDQETRWLIRTIVYNDPTKECIINSTPKKFAYVPRTKSLWNTPKDRGLPIGNLTSQFFSNVYLNALDQFVIHDLKIPRYIRFVDDFIIIHPSPTVLNNAYLAIEKFLFEHLNLVLHPKKHHVSRAQDGLDFLGYYILPGRTYLRRNVVSTITRRVQSLTINQQTPPEITQKATYTLNSYFGFLINASSYRFRKRLAKTIHRKTNGILHCDKTYAKIQATP